MSDHGGMTRVLLGTATPGGGFPLYGGVIAEAIHQADPSLEVITRNTKGSTENLPLLEAGELDLGLVQGEVAHEAIAGLGRAPADIKILAAMYSTAGMFVVRADSAARSIADLRGKPIAFGAKGSGLVILSRYVLDGLGLVQDSDFEAVYLQRAGDGPAMVLDGRVAALWGGGVGWPGFSAVAGSPAGARFITPRCRGGRTGPAKACLSQALDRGARRLSRAGPADRLGRLLELHHGAPDAARRSGLAAGARSASVRNRAAGKAGTGARVHCGQHPGGGAAHRADPSWRAAIFT